MKEIKMQVSAIETAIAEALERKRRQLHRKEEEFIRKLSDIKSRLLEIENDFEDFEESKDSEFKDKDTMSEIKKPRGRPLPEVTVEAYFNILKTLYGKELTVIEVCNLLGRNDIASKKLTRKRMERLEEAGDIAAINRDSSKARQQNVKYKLTQQGIEKLKK